MSNLDAFDPRKEKPDDNPPTFIEINSPEASSNFRKFLMMAKKTQGHGAAVDVHSVATYKTHRKFITPDGRAGYSVSPEGELTSVFNTRAPKEEKPWTNVARHAAEHAQLVGGATWLTAFDNPRLTDPYQKAGFRPLSRSQFVEDYKPRGWKDSNGRPDVAYMALDRSKAFEANDAVDPQFDRSTDGKAPRFDDKETGYDQGTALVKSRGDFAAKSLGLKYEPLKTTPPIE